MTALRRDPAIQPPILEDPAEGVAIIEAAYVPIAEAKISVRVKLDDRIYGNGVPGAVTMRLRQLYWAKHDEGWEATPIDYD